MSEPLPQGNIIDPPPDPWASAEANGTQAASFVTGGTGVLMMLGDEPGAGVFNPEAMAWLPDPNQVFASVAQILGFQFDRSDAFSWGFILVILSVVLNLYSLWQRYRYAQYVKPRWDEQIPRLEREAAQWRRAQGATPQAKTQGAGGGAA